MIVLDFTTGANNGRWDDLNNPVKYYFSNGTGLTHKQLLMRTFVYGMRKAGLMGANGKRSYHPYACSEAILIIVPQPEGGTITFL